MTDATRLRQLWEGWQPPPELQRSRPRPVRYTAGGKATLVLAVALLTGAVTGAAVLYKKAQDGSVRNRPPLWLPPVLLVAGGVSALLIRLKLSRERRLLEDGHAAPGIVTRLGARTDKGRLVYYEFATYSGSTVKGKYGPVHGKWVLAVGTPIVVLYDRDQPKRNTRYPSSLVTLDY
jgi:hypothetical protein